MHILFVHRAFPGQFRYVAPLLARRYGWRCTFVTADGSIPAPPELTKIVYATHDDERSERTVAAAATGPVAHAMGVYQALRARPEIEPDLIFSHGSFGSTLFLPYLYDAHVINFFEYFHRPVRQDLDYRPEQPVTEQMLLRCRVENAMTLLDLDNCDRAWTPTRHQGSLMPREYHEKIEVVHDGIDTEAFRPMPGAPRRLPDGTEVPPGTRVVTYASRGFEKLRGFDVFMRVAKHVYRRYPDVLFVVAGGDGIVYGSESQRGGYRTFRERVLAEGDFDLSHFRFVGKLPQAQLARLVAFSDLHVYLTVPFFTSWSPLEAMASGCVVLGSDTACVTEYLRDGHNGLVCDFFDEEGMASKVVDVLKDPAAYRPLGEAARRTIERDYSIEATLPRIKAMFERVASKRREPTLRLEKLIRANVPAPAPVSVSPARAPSPTVRPLDLPPYDGSIPFRMGPAPINGHRRRSGVAGSQPLGVPGPVDMDLSSFAFLATPVAPRARSRQGQPVVLFAWELGAGLGHLVQMRPLAETLAELGHRVIVCLRDLSRATAVFRHPNVRFVQAPAWTGGGARFPKPRDYAQMLMNVGFGSDVALAGRAEAWRELLVTYAPDLMVVDHAPTALLASRGLAVRVALLGSGFCCPPDAAGGGAWGAMRPAAPDDAPGAADAPSAATELLVRLNRLLRRWRAPALERLGRLYSDADENFLTTFPELDHVPGRRGGAYWGPTIGQALGGAALPDWPAGDGPRVFAYLKTAPWTGRVLEALTRRKWPTLVYVEGASATLRRRLESPSLRVSDVPVDLSRVGRDCDMAVLNGGHSTTAELLLAGKPVVQIPMTQEQELTAAAVERIGAGRAPTGGSCDGAGAALDAVLDPRYAEAARRFAERYASFDPGRQRRAMLARVEELMAAAATAS
jgi:glycosyltransferase involved in cell wall biosynthesis/UDP:flavonoid glycosyltransferase YjiC (YdhE family)